MFSGPTAVVAPTWCQHMGSERGDVRAPFYLPGPGQPNASKYMKIHQIYLLPCWNCFESSREFKEIQGNPRKSEGIQGNPRESKEIPGNPRKYRKIQENCWNYPETTRNYFKAYFSRPPGKLKNPSSNQGSFKSPSLINWTPINVKKSYNLNVLR